VARTVNTTQVIANWLIGREIVAEEQHGAQRAGYGGHLLEELSRQLAQPSGRFSVRMRMGGSTGLPDVETA
jgi:hypothetical protein